MAATPPDKPTEDPTKDRVQDDSAHPRGDDAPDEAARRRSAAKADSDLSSWYRMTGLGVEFIVAVALMGAIGWYADRKLDTRPWLTLVGVGLGFAIGLWTVVRVAMKSFR